MYLKIRTKLSNRGSSTLRLAYIGGNGQVLRPGQTRTVDYHLESREMRRPHRQALRHDLDSGNLYICHEVKVGDAWVCLEKAVGAECPRERSDESREVVMETSPVTKEVEEIQSVEPAEYEDSTDPVVEESPEPVDDPNEATGPHEGFLRP